MEFESRTRVVSFDLIDEPWIPVIDLEGREREVSLREAILSSHEFRDIAGELPTTRFALLRILLAVAYRVLDRHPVDIPTEAWGELWKQDRLPASEFERYFEEWRHRFDLLDTAQPFMQSPELRTAKDEWKPVSLIVADADPDGALFTMRSELDSLSPAEAARWLVHAHAYDYSGIKSGAVGDGRVKGGKGYPMGIGWAGWLGGTALGGANLRETILLNLIMGRGAAFAGDAPVWERPVLGPAERSPAEIGVVGPTALMTWPQRRIRLHVSGGRITGVLVTNGDPLDYTVQNTTETMTGWRYSDPQSAKAKSLRYMPHQLEPGRSLWRGLSTLIPTQHSAPPPAAAKKKWSVGQAAEPAHILSWLGQLVADGELHADRFVEVSVVSMEYGTQMASYAGVWSDRLSFAAALADLKGASWLLGVAQEGSRRAESAVAALQRLARDIEKAAGGDGEGAYASVGNAAYAAFDRAFREWLRDLKPGRDGEKLLMNWTERVRSSVRARAEELAQAAPDAAWVGRPSDVGGQVLSVATVMRWFENALFRELGAAPKPHLGGASPDGSESGSAVGTEAA